MLPQINIPSRLAGAFEPSIPVDADIAELGQTDVGESLIADAALWSQYASARVWEKFPKTLPIDGNKMLSTVWTARDLADTYRRGEMGDKLAAISQGGLAALETLFEAMSLVEGVPIIGMVAQIGITAQKLFWNQWIGKHTEKPPEDGFEWNRESDVAAQRYVLREIESGDLTGVFLPFVSVEGWDRRRVQDLVKGGSRNRWTLVAPKGPSLGVGCVPGTNIIARGWQNAYPWSTYRPGAVSACTVAWQLAIGHTRTRYLVDATRLREEWKNFWWQLQMLSLNDDYKHVLQMALKPLVLPPDSGGWVPQFDYARAVAAGFNADLPGLTAFNIENGLRARQVKGLGTLLVAYVSRDDPAFASDPELAELLETNRRKLLEHAAIGQVDLARVPDPDYRSKVEVAKRQAGGGGEQVAGPGPTPTQTLMAVPATPKIPPPLVDLGVGMKRTNGTKGLPMWAKVVLGLSVAAGVGGLVYTQTR